jgi:hypothetical protein
MFLSLSIQMAIITYTLALEQRPTPELPVGLLSMPTKPIHDYLALFVSPSIEDTNSYTLVHYAGYHCHNLHKSHEHDSFSSALKPSSLVSSMPASAR